MNKNTGLTTQQKNLIKEIDELMKLFNLDYNNAQFYKSETRTIKLRMIKDQIIRSEIIMRYLTIDEFLNDIIVNYFFGTKKTYIYLWKTKKFQIFNYWILESLGFFQKVNLVNSIKKIPSDISNNMDRCNKLRNGIVHNLFSENSRSLNKSKYRGKDIFSIDGMKLFEQDMKRTNSYFMRERRLFRMLTNI